MQIAATTWETRPSLPCFCSASTRRYVTGLLLTADGVFVNRTLLRPVVAPRVRGGGILKGMLRSDSVCYTRTSEAAALIEKHY